MKIFGVFKGEPYNIIYGDFLEYIYKEFIGDNKFFVLFLITPLKDGCFGFDILFFGDLPEKNCIGFDNEIYEKDFLFNKKNLLDLELNKFFGDSDFVYFGYPEFIFFVSGLDNKLSKLFSIACSSLNFCFNDKDKNLGFVFKERSESLGMEGKEIEELFNLLKTYNK